MTSVTIYDKADWVSVAGEPLQVTAAMPDSESVIVPVTVIGEVVTVALGAGELTETVGAVLSIFRVTEVATVALVLSLTVPEMT